VEVANRTEFTPVAAEMTAVALETLAKDRERWQARVEAMDRLSG
jgi:hypothetical protein